MLWLLSAAVSRIGQRSGSHKQPRQHARTCVDDGVPVRLALGVAELGQLPAAAAPAVVHKAAVLELQERARRSGGRAGGGGGGLGARVLCARAQCCVAFRGRGTNNREAVWSTRHRMHVPRQPPAGPQCEPTSARVAAAGAPVPPSDMLPPPSTTTTRPA
jgi:hypothetical protein